MNADKNLNRLDYMADACERIMSAIAGMTAEEFAENRDKQDIVVRNVITLGEAARYTDERIREKYPSLPWQEAIDLRNSVTHEYMRVDYFLVWDTIQAKFTNLKELIEDVKAAYPWPVDDQENR